MRTISAAALGAVVIGSVVVLTAGPASAHCVEVTGTQNKLVEVGGPFGPITVWAPGTIDTHPTGCVTMVTDLVPPLTS